MDTTYWRYGPSFRSKCATLDRFAADKNNIDPDEDLCTKNKESCKILSNGEGCRQGCRQGRRQIRIQVCHV